MAEYRIRNCLVVVVAHVRRWLAATRQAVPGAVCSVVNQASCCCHIHDSRKSSSTPHALRFESALSQTEPSIVDYHLQLLPSLPLFDQLPCLDATIPAYVRPRLMRLTPSASASNDLLTDVFLFARQPSSRQKADCTKSNMPSKPFHTPALPLAFSPRTVSSSPPNARLPRSCLSKTHLLRSSMF